MISLKESSNEGVLDLIAESMEDVTSTYKGFPISCMWKYSKSEEPIEIEKNVCRLHIMSPLWDIYSRGWKPNHPKLSKYYTEYVSDYLTDIEDMAREGHYSDDITNRRRLNLLSNIFQNEAFYDLILEAKVKDLGDSLKKLDFKLEVIGDTIAKSTLEFDPALDDKEIIDEEIESLLMLAV